MQGWGDSEYTIYEKSVNRETEEDLPKREKTRKINLEQEKSEMDSYYRAEFNHDLYGAEHAKRPSRRNIREPEGIRHIPSECTALQSELF